MLVTVGGAIIEFAASELIPSVLVELGARALWRIPRQRALAEPARPALPERGWPRPVSKVRVLSSTPGRLRVEVVGLRGQSMWCAELIDRLKGQPGVRFCRANATTGALLVVFERESNSEARLVRLVEQAAAGWRAVRSEAPHERPNLRIAS